MTGESIRSRAPAASSPITRRVMQSNVFGDGREPTPQTRLKKALRNAGIVVHSDCRPEPSIRCNADLVFPSHQICIFVDGCFWHGCDAHFVPPKTNTKWWIEKIHATIERDHRQKVLLENRGWKVIRVWEHQLTVDHIDIIVSSITDIVAKS